MARKDRPNQNHILAVMRDYFGGDNEWGTAMAWGGAVCDVLYDADPNMVPSHMGYSPGMGGPEVPKGSAEDPVHHITVKDIPHETAYVWCWLHDLDESTPDTHPDVEDLPYWEDPAFRARADELLVAAKCLSRYIDWCKSAGLSY